MIIVRETFISAPIRAVFDFVSEPGNDPQWCAKVASVEQTDGDGPGPGARYSVVHRPIPFRPARTMDYSCVSWDPPHHIEWREDDEHDVIDVTYELAATNHGTRFRQRDDAELSAPRLLHPLLAMGIGHDVKTQLQTLKRHLEDAQAASRRPTSLR